MAESPGFPTLLLSLGAAALLLAGVVLCIVFALRRRRTAAIATAVTAVALALIVCIPTVAMGDGWTRRLPGGAITQGAYRLPDGEYGDTALYGMDKLADLVYEHASDKSFDYRDYTTYICGFEYSVGNDGEWYSSFEMTTPHRSAQARRYECNGGRMLYVSDGRDISAYSVTENLRLDAFRALLRTLEQADLEGYVESLNAQAANKNWHLVYLGRDAGQGSGMRTLLVTSDGIAETDYTQGAQGATKDTTSGTTPATTSGAGMYLLLAVGSETFRLVVPHEAIAV